MGLAKKVIYDYVLDMDNETLYSRLLKRLELERGRWRHIAAATGLRHDYISRLVQGRGGAPAIDRVQKLADHLGLDTGQGLGISGEEEGEKTVQSKSYKRNRTPKT